MPAADGSGKTSTQKLNYDQLEKLFNDLREEKAKLLGQKAELLKEPTEIAKKRDDYLKHHMIGFGPTQIDGLIRKMDQFRLLHPAAPDQRQSVQHRRSLRSLPRRYSRAA